MAERGYIRSDPSFFFSAKHTHTARKGFSPSHRHHALDHTKGSNRLSFTLKHTSTHTLTQPYLCVLFALSEMYCLGKWVCAPSGGISMNKNLNALPYYSSLSLFSRFLSLSCSFSLCGLCLAQHPQSLRAQIDIGDLVINMWDVNVCVYVCFCESVSVCVCVCVHALAMESNRVLLSFVCRDVVWFVLRERWRCVCDCVCVCVCVSVCGLTSSWELVKRQVNSVKLRGQRTF